MPDHRLTGPNLSARAISPRQEDIINAKISRTSRASRSYTCFSQRTHAYDLSEISLLLALSQAIDFCNFATNFKARSKDLCCSELYIRGRIALNLGNKF